MLDDTSLPTDRSGREAWIAAAEERIAAKVRAGLRRVITEAYTRFTATLTASGDIGELDTIPENWLTVVRSEIADDLGEVYQAGQVTAWLGMKIEPTPAFAQTWTAVANENAVSYMTDATNRLAGVGDSTWRLIRQQTQTAIGSGMSTEELKGRIEQLAGFSEFRADTIARTETVGAYVQGDMAGARALGANGPVEKVWVTTTDRRTRESHAAAHDQVRPLDAPFDVGGIRMDAPHDPGAPPGEVVNCRCYTEMLYVGDTRPDGTEVVAAEPEPDVILPSLDVDSEYTGTPRRGMGDIPVPVEDMRPGMTAHAHIGPDGQFTPERQRLHDDIVRSYLADAPRQAHPEMQFMGGGGGAGKSTMIREGLVKIPDGAITINADDLKDRLPETAIAKASGDRSWAAAAHEESSYLAARVRVAAIESNVSIVMDAVGSNANRVIQQVNAARSAGYTVRASYVSIPPETGVARAVKRAADMEAAGEVGRVIPDEIVRQAHIGANAAFEQVASVMDEAVLLDNSVTPTVVAQFIRGQRTILDDDLWAEFLTRGRPVGALG